MATETAQDNELRQFTRARQQVTEVVRAAWQRSQSGHLEAEEEQVRGLLVKLAEDRFNLVVVGQFKRGKSSLMNAIVGRELLPTGLLPLTSAITSLRYGPDERATLKRAGWVLEQEISLEELPDYVTEQGNPGNAKGVIEVQIELPVPFLRRGLYFVDTPGIGSSRTENTATTYSFLPQADAVLFVTSVEAPLSDAEEAFLRDVQQYARRLFVVVNKMDLLTASESEQVLNYIKTGATRILGRAEVRLYPLSARRALQAKLSGLEPDPDREALHCLEADLDRFLADEKSRIFLVSILDRLLEILGKAAQADEAFLELRQTAQSLQMGLLNGLETLPTPAAPTGQVPRETEEQIFADVRRPQETLRTRTCPICAALTQTLFDFFAQYQGRLADDPQVRQAFLASKGFCRVHTWQFEQIASPQGISEGYVTFVEAVSIALQEQTQRAPAARPQALQAFLPDGEHCPACRLLREQAAQERQRFIAYLATPDGQAYFRLSLGLCLPHLQEVLAETLPPRVANFLLAEEARQFERLAEDMHSYTLKRDAIRRHLLNADEEHAWKRALLQLVGDRNAHIS
jgi:GTP-binding protein EngB required for normal cell division